MAPIPNCIFYKVPNLQVFNARQLALAATRMAKQAAPKLTGKLADSLQPYWEPGHFGVSWSVDYGYYQEKGIKPFTMHNLAGKTIPMWVSDEDHKLRDDNPDIETRMNHGRLQVLIFRRAAQPGTRKIVYRNGRRVEVPRSYPGAPGRIAPRYSDPIVPPGKFAGQIAKGNVGVRWRHPGLDEKLFVADSIVQVAHMNNVRGTLYVGSI